VNILAQGRAGILAALALLTTLSAPAAELREIEVVRDDDYYRLRSTAWFINDQQALYEVLTNYDLFRYFTSAIVESRNLDPDKQGRPRYFTRMEGCVLMWCKSFERTGHLELEPADEIVAIADPEESDFKRSYERWRLQPEKGGTLLIYEFEMIPDFWVPPLIGPFLIQRTLKAGGERALERIEALAQAQYEFD
jgi:hypothetical protein